LLGLGSAALAGLLLKGDKRMEGSFVNDSFPRGHLLRGRAGFPPGKRVEKIPVVIVGGGIAGLSAAWRLQKRGFSDFVLLEMSSQPGGNARRDDYGALARDTSAWAGVHYFSSRQPEEKGPLTWPEGNGWITRRLLERVGGNIRTSQMVHRITETRRGASVFAEETEFQAQFVIFAAPTFLAPYLLEDFPPLHDFVYSPWLTANLTLERYPESRGAEPSWDTVFLDSPTLGYVDAMHQSLRTHVDRTVWTFYWALAEGAPAQNRQLLLEKDWAYWKEAILHDLERVHSDIRQCLSRIDVMRMGHAMIRPAVGSIFSEERRRLRHPNDRI